MHIVRPREAGCALQVRAFGWPEAVQDVGKHAGLLSLWLGTDHHVPEHVPAASACTLHTLLGDQEPGDIRSLAARADKLWATQKPQSHDLVASVDTAEELFRRLLELDLWPYSV
jgi:hypothetical protein